MGGAFFPEPQHADEGKRRWLAVGAGAAVVVVIVVALVVFGRNPQAGAPKEAPQPEYAVNLHISDLKLSAAENFVGGSVNYIDGKITNAGDKTVAGCRIEAVFRNSLGQIVQRETQPLMILQVRPGYGYQDLTPLSSAPLLPNQVREFRLTFEHISADWDHGYPELRVVSLNLK
jgi:hypothetical protein